MSRASDPIRDRLSKQVAFGIAGVGEVVTAALDLIDSLAGRVTALEARLAEYDPSAIVSPDDAAGPPATPPENAPAAPHPDSPNVPEPLPGQTTIDDELAPRPRTLAGQDNRARLLACLREHGGRASRKTIATTAGIKPGSVADTIQNAVRDGAVIDTGEREKTRGPSSPIFALAEPAPSRSPAGSRADAEDRGDQALGEIERTMLLGPEEAARRIREQDAPAQPRARASAPAREPRAQPTVSQHVRREMERAARQAAGEDIPRVRPERDAERVQLKRALANGPRDHQQLGRILGVSPRRAAEMMVAAHEAGDIVVERGVARLV